MAKQQIGRIVIFALAFFLGAGIFGLLIYREGFWTILATIQGFGLMPFLGFLVISSANFVLYSLRWQLILNHQLASKDRISLSRMVFHRSAGYAISYLTPVAQAGGEPMRVAMLMSDGVSGRKATSSVMLDIAIELIAYISFIMAGVALAIMTGLDLGNTLFAAAGGLLFMLALLSIFLFQVAKGKGVITKIFFGLRLHRVRFLAKFTEHIQEIERAMGVFFRAPKWFLLLVAALAVIVISFRVAEVVYLAHFFSVPLTFAQAFLIATLPGIALLLPIPAGLGIFEGTFASLFLVLGVPLSAVAFALIIRVRDLAFIGVGVIHLLRQSGIVLQDVLVRIKNPKSRV